MGGGPPCFPQDFTSPVVLRIWLGKRIAFCLRGFHPLWLTFPGYSAKQFFCNFPRELGLSNEPFLQPQLGNAPRL